MQVEWRSNLKGRPSPWSKLRSPSKDISKSAERRPLVTLQQRIKRSRTQGAAAHNQISSHFLDWQAKRLTRRANKMLAFGTKKLSDSKGMISQCKHRKRKGGDHHCAFCCSRNHIHASSTIKRKKDRWSPVWHIVISWDRTRKSIIGLPSCQLHRNATIILALIHRSLHDGSGSEHTPVNHSHLHNLSSCVPYICRWCKICRKDISRRTG